MKIAVVGLGAIGSQVLWQLSKQPGIEVHGFDTHYPGHSTAGAGGENRVYWNLELADPEYAPIIVRAREAWARLEQESGVELREQTGVLIFGDADAAQLQVGIASAELTGAPIEVLDHADLRQRFPQFGASLSGAGVWDVEGAIIRPELTVATAAKLAEQNGAIIHRFARVEGIELGATPGAGRGPGAGTSPGAGVTDGGTVLTDDCAHTFDRIVVAAGGWTPKLLPYLRDQVVARGLTSAWYFGEEADYLRGLPPFLRTAPGYCYGLPSSDHRSVKLGLGFNDHFVTGDPDTLQRSLRHDALAKQIDKFSWMPERLLPGLSPHPFRVNTFVESYTRSMMEHIAFHPESDDVLVLTGFSGHGFRAAPAIGEIGAELILEGKTTTDISFLAAAQPVFEILDSDTGEASHNPLMAGQATA